LIGDRFARSRLNTPALVLDLDRLTRNITRMAEAARESRIQVRPHVKCHKSVEIARLQLAGGAVGVCCATIGEAEIMAAAGIAGVLITSPLTTIEKIDRAVELCHGDGGLCLVTDHSSNAELLSRRFSRRGRSVDVLIDVDAGMHRTGVVDQKRAIELARLLHDLEHLQYRGVQCFAGHVQHLEHAHERQEGALAVLGSLRVLCEELRAIGLDPPIISGGGTGSYEIDGPAGVLTELQVGSYVFMDAQYDRVWTRNGAAPPFENSLFVQTTVVSNNHAGRVICDAGIKHLSADDTPVVARGAPASAAYQLFGDEHGLLTFTDRSRSLELGDRIELIVPHCDPTVNLFDQFHCVRGDELVAIWRIDARGA
jgi:D-serine deaminase-like pyridoxal phosphate-dependent protein